MATSDKTASGDEHSEGVGISFVGIVAGFLALLLALSLFSHDAGDLAILEGGCDGQVVNWIGPIGAGVAKTLLYFIGLVAYPLAVFSLLCVGFSFTSQPLHKRRGFILSCMAMILGGSMLMGMYPEHFVDMTDLLGIGRKGAPTSALSGGVVGQALAAPPSYERHAGFLRHYMGTVGAGILASLLLAAGAAFLLHIEFKRGYVRLFSGEEVYEDEVTTSDKKADKKTDKKADESAPLSEKERSAKELELQREKRQKQEREALKSEELNLESQPQEKPAPKPEPVIPQPILLTKVEEPESASHESAIAEPVVVSAGKSSTAPRKAPVKLVPKDKAAAHDFVLPPLTILEKLGEVGGESAEFVEEAKKTLQLTLNSFNVDAKVTESVTGPRVTRIEVVPAPGINVNKITALENNIKLTLRAESIRILAPIPGKDACGIEVPNRKAAAIGMREMLESKAWGKNSYEIPIVLGKNVAGETIITDLARAPHLLIAGATGSGKSVCMNTLIMSLLFKFSPSDLRMILVDPKVVEFEMYKTLPHLITPIVNEPKKVPLALRWGIIEMEKRYKLLAKARVKNLESYNNRPKTSEPVLDDDGEPIPARLPFIVIIIDELADIIMVSKKEVETSIARIAQKARAVGIHLVLATQRPSVQVITGVIKANLPTRIAFKVASITDSRVILDSKGAEALLNKGDMLFIPPGASKLERIQGAYASDPDIEKVVAFVSNQAGQEFDDTVLSGGAVELPEGEGEEGGGEEGDYVPSDAGGAIGEGDLMKKAVEIVRKERKASTSYLQRRLGIGYNRAADLMDKLEDMGVIGPQIGSTPREILVSPDDPNPA